ncbi:unnamed protein product [Paramecium sonneborni]|uniref:RING-type E3 ubiquitin transferase n=1 Tax=Paramecium sonneborni TaxID=65129 RepID=A0A8S1QYM4_9CILI|nr:unnamed protein product [Paramecium sonneborni]
MSKVPLYCKMIQSITEDYQNPINQYQILQTFIFQNQNFGIKQKTFQKQQNSACGQFISDHILSFQCFTCGSEATHMYCQQCFEPEQHRNHQCVMDLKNSGICDCGVQSIIKQEGFCSAHKTQNNFKTQKGIDQIPTYIQNNISDFIQALTQVYSFLMKNIKNNCSNVKIKILNFYHYANFFKDQYLQKLIISQQNIKNFYDTLRKASYIHTILFQTIQSLLEQDFCYQPLITKSLSNFCYSNNGKKIMEILLEYQIYIEVYSKFNYFEIDKILYQLYTDENFKAFMFSQILKYFSQLWLIQEVEITSQNQIIEDLLLKLRESQNINTYFNQIYLQLATYFDPYFSELQTTRKKIHHVFASEIIMSETQFISKEMQKEFFCEKNSVQDFVVLIEKLMYSCNNLCSKIQLIIPSLFRRRFEYKTFIEIGFDQLKVELDHNFNSFLNQDIQINVIKKFNYSKFAISYLIDCLGKGIDRINLDNIPYTKILLADTIHYILDQAKYFSAIRVGLQTIFTNSKCTDKFKQNLIKVLFYQTYCILKKSFDLFSFDIHSISNQLHDGKLQIIKNGMIIQKLFTLFLSYLYCTNKFLEGKQFFLYLLDILDESEQQFECFLNYMFIQILQVYCFINCNNNQHLIEVYQGTEKNTEFSSFEQVDKCFIKLYIFLFGQTVFSRFEESFQKNTIIPQRQLSQIKQKLFYDMIITENDLYNICSPFLTELSDDLKLSLVKIVSNHLNLSTFLEYKKLKALLKEQGILLNENFPKHILQICEVDQTLKKLKLKDEYKILYEPTLMLDKDSKGKIVERFIEQHRTEREIQFGNGIQWDFEQYSNEHYRVLQFTILRNYCASNLIQQNIQNFLFIQKGNFQELCYLILIQIIAQKYFHKNEFELFVNIYIIELEEIQKQQYLDMKKQNLQNLILTIKDLNKQQIEDDQSLKKLKFQIQKDKFKAKFNKQSNQIQKTLDQHEQQYQPVMNEEKSLCFTCKLELTSENTVGMLFIYLKSKQLIVDETIQILENQLKFDIDLGLQTCRHYFHDNCLIECFENTYKNDENDFPNKIQLDCPVCKQPCLFTFHIFEIFDDKKMESLNQSLILHYSILKGDQYFLTDILRTQTLIGIYINLFFDLLIQLFVNPQEYKRDQKDKVFKQLLFCYFETTQGLDLIKDDMLKISKKLDQQTNIILNILNMILEIQLKEKTLNQLRLQIIQLIQQYRQFSKEETFLLISSFGIQSQEILKQQNNEQITQFIEDKYLRNYQSLVYNTQELIKNLLGQTFQQFHGMYFGNKCNLCKFYNSEKKKNKGVSVCLLCQQLLCNYSCAFNENGNLNKHAQTYHKGISIFISLQNSSVYLMSSPLSIKYQKCLYFNDLGERIVTENPKADWNTYVLDVNKANELASIIINCQYSKIIKNKEFNNQLLDDLGIF